MNDPYEGELFTNFLQLFGGISAKDIEQIWQAKRGQLVKVDYKLGSTGPITVEKGKSCVLYAFLSSSFYSFLVNAQIASPSWP